MLQFALPHLDGKVEAKKNEAKEVTGSRQSALQPRRYIRAFLRHRQQCTVERYNCMQLCEA